MPTVRKKVPSPLRIYNLFNRIYYRYFSDINIRGGKHIKSIKTEEYLTYFVEKHYRELKSFDNLKNYILWAFKEKGRIPINHLHRHIKDWNNHESSDIIYFADNVAEYIRTNRLTLREYLEPVPNYYAHIIQQYIGQKNIPFEFLLYTKSIDKVDKKQTKMLKVLLKDEFYEMDAHIKRMKENKKFLRGETDRLKILI